MAAPLDPQVLAWFQAVDTDRTGRISALELQQALTNANWSHFSPETVRLLIGMFDRDYSGQIDAYEFQGLWQYIHQWKQTFDMFDRDRSGSIDQNELHNALTQMGYRLSPGLARLIVFKYDVMYRARVTLDHFISACALLQTITADFRARDVTGAGVVRMNYEDFMCLGVKHRPM